MSDETANNGTDAILACAIARDIDAFDLLIEDMESEFQENWGALTFDAAPDVFDSEIGDGLKYVMVAADKEDENDLADIANVIRAARDAKIKVILVPHDLNTVVLHQLSALRAPTARPAHHHTQTQSD